MPEHTDQTETFIWKGQTRYKCGGRWESGAPCEFDTHDMDLLAKHRAEPHMRAIAYVPASAQAHVPPSVYGTEAQAADFKEARFADVDDLDG